MGKRRIRNLMELKVDKIIGFDICEDRRKQVTDLYPIEIVDDLESAFSKNPDAMIISTPPDKHKEYALIASKKKIPFFTEVNTMTPEDMQSIINSMNENKTVGIPSSNVMFHPSLVKMKELLDHDQIGQPLTFNFHSGAYLPDWHPWEKLDEYYVNQKNTGGGRDQIMWELVWVYQLMGRPKIITAFTKKLGTFEADIFDVYDLLIIFDNGVLGQIMVDVIQRPPTRFCQIIGTKGTIRWDYDQKLVRIYSTETKKWTEYPEEENYKGYNVESHKPGFTTKDRGFVESYVDEMKNFIEVICKNKKPEFTFEDEKILLETMYAAEKSSENGIHVKI